MQTAVIYARYSSESQNEQSIEGQLRVCNAYAEAHHLLVLNQYIDRAMTGRNDARPEFQKMLADSKDHKFEVVLVYKLDRFSRNKYESVMHKKTLKDNGVIVVSATENIPDTPEGVILESLLEGMNQYYSMELSQKVHRGLTESYLKGNFTGGRIRYGYRVEGKKVYIVEEEAAIIREVYFKYAQGYTVPDILLSLNNRNLRNREGNPFHVKYLYDMLNYPKYRGLVEHDGVVYDNIFPRIISDEIWEKVSQRHQEDALGVGVKTSSNYLLSGRMYCAHCFHPLIGISAHGRHCKYYYYACNRGRRVPNDCEARPLDRDTIHDIVFNTTCALVADNNMIAELAHLIMQEHNRAVKDDYTLQSLESRLQTVKRAMENMLRAIESGIITEQTKARMEELQEQAQRLQLEINVEKIRVRPDLETIDVVDFLRSQFFGETQDDEIRKALLKTFIYTIIRDDNKITIVYNFRNNYNPTKIKREELETLLHIAEQKGVVFKKATYFFTPDRFGVQISYNPSA